MVGVAGPLVKGSNQDAVVGARSLLCLLGGLLLGATTTGVLLTMTTPIQNVVTEHVALTIFAVIGAAMVAVDLGKGGRFAVLGWKRQTCQAWARSKHRNVASVAWGFDLGLGFTTFRVSSLYWVAALGTTLFASASLAPLLPISYAIGLMIGIIAALLMDRHLETRMLVHQSPYVRRIIGLVMTVVITVIVVTS